MRLAQFNRVDIGDAGDRSARSIDKGREAADELATILPNTVDDAMKQGAVGIAGECFAPAHVDPIAVVRTREVEAPLTDERNGSRDRRLGVGALAIERRSDAGQKNQWKDSHHRRN